VENRPPASARLDTFVFDQVRAALLRPDVLTAGKQALAMRAPAPDDLTLWSARSSVED
jgi:hypothetical protein